MGELIQILYVNARVYLVSKQNFLVNFLPKLQINLCLFIPIYNFQSKINSYCKLIIWWEETWNINQTFTTNLHITYSKWLNISCHQAGRLSFWPWVFRCTGLWYSPLYAEDCRHPKTPKACEPTCNLVGKAHKKVSWLCCDQKVFTCWHLTIYEVLGKNANCIFLL